MFCEYCGAADMNSNFCRSCGRKLAVAESKIAPKPLLMLPSEYLAAQSDKQMTFTGAISACFSKFADFSGRATLAEYWWFALFNVLIYVSVLFLLYLSGIGSTAGGGASEGAVLLFYIPVLVLLIPNLSVTIRRLHDAGHPGTYFLFNFIPFIGPFIVFIFALQPSEESDNKYGAVS